MKRNTRKGFTGIELVIVIAIIAILAAALIPTFGGLFDSANKTADTQGAREMAMAVMAAAPGEKIEVQRVIEILDAAGFDITSLKPLYKNHEFYWSKEDATIVLWNTKEGKATYPTDIAGTPDDKDEDGNPVWSLLMDNVCYFVTEVHNGTEFLKALESGTSVKLNDHVEVNEYIDITGDITIDLNGKNFTSTGTHRPFWLRNGSLTIKAEGSTIDCADFGLVDVKGGDANTVVINGGTFNANLNDASFVKIRQGASAHVVLNNVTYRDESSTGWVLDDLGNGSTVEINGGSYTSTYGFMLGGNVEFTDVTINTEALAVEIGNGGIGEIKNCTITTGNDKAGSVPAVCVFASYNASVTVTNCTLASNGVGAYGVANTGGSIVASGNTGLNTHWFTDTMDSGCTGSITIDGTVYSK